jgi:hypothetical protein
MTKAKAIEWLCDLLAMAIFLAVGLLLEVLLRALVGDWWPWPWLAIVMAAQVIVMVLTDRHFARLVSRYPWLLRWSSQPAAPLRPSVASIARIEAERRALERLLSSVAQPAPPQTQWKRNAQCLTTIAVMYRRQAKSGGSYFAGKLEGKKITLVKTSKKPARRVLLGRRLSPAKWRARCDRRGGLGDD